MTVDLECARCGRTFPLREEHTELVRRDFFDAPQSSKIEHLCADCFEAYEQFLAGEFQELS